MFLMDLEGKMIIETSCEHGVSVGNSWLSRGFDGRLQ